MTRVTRAARPARPLRRVRATAAVLLALALTACASGAMDAEPTSTPTPTPSPTPEPTPEPILAPLTGMPLDAALTGPAVMAKIDDHPGAWPQYGLESADIVFEELVEGGLTRYLAIWHSHIPDEIGPVRSIRPMDPSIAAPFGGIIAYSGGQQRFLDLIQATGLLNAVHGGEYDGYFFRTSERAAPHNVILQAARLAADHPELGAPAPYFSYAVDAPASAAVTPASAIDLAFSTSEARQWRCDAARGAWLRSQNGAVDADSSGAQRASTNLVVLEVGVIDDIDVPSTQFIGTGTGVVASGCGAIPVMWSKAGEADAVQLTTPDGAPVLLAPGTTWVELVPTSGSVAVA